MNGMMAEPEWDRDSDHDEEGKSDDDSTVFNELKETLYRRDIDAIDKELKELETNTHEAHNAEVNELEMQKEKRLEQCKIYSRYLTQCVNSRFNKQKKESEEALAKAIVSEKADVLTSLHDKIKRLAEERTNDDLTNVSEAQDKARATTRKLRYRTGDDKKDVSEKPKESKRRKLHAQQGPKYTIKLSEADITDDASAVLGVARTGKANRRR